MLAHTPGTCHARFFTWRSAVHTAMRLQTKPPERSEWRIVWNRSGLNSVRIPRRRQARMQFTGRLQVLARVRRRSVTRPASRAASTTQPCQVPIVMKVSAETASHSAGTHHHSNRHSTRLVLQRQRTGEQDRSLRPPLQRQSHTLHVDRNRRLNTRKSPETLLIYLWDATLAVSATLAPRELKQALAHTPGTYARLFRGDPPSIRRSAPSGGSSGTDQGSTVFAFRGGDKRECSSRVACRSWRGCGAGREAGEQGRKHHPTLPDPHRDEGECGDRKP